jgi:ribosomal protein S18 acetylase RimI-like enzyme
MTRSAGDRPDVRVLETPADALHDYARVPIVFETHEVVRVARAEEGPGIRLDTETLHAPFTKDYDALPDASPVEWARRFDLSRWTLFGAFTGDERVGGAALVTDRAGIDMLDGQDDAALLWDIRVSPTCRRAGVGSALLAAVERVAITRGARWLDVETQNVNVPACRFYERLGFRVRAANVHAYPDLPDEIQLIWRKALHG